MRVYQDSDVLTETTNGTKPGINPSNQAVLAEYGDKANKRFEAMGSALFGKVAAFKWIRKLWLILYKN